MVKRSSSIPKVNIIGSEKSITQTSFIWQCKTTERLKHHFADLRQMGVSIYYPDKKNDRNISLIDNNELYKALFVLRLDPVLVNAAFGTISHFYFDLYNRGINITDFNLAQLQKIRQPYAFIHNTHTIRLQALREFFEAIITQPVKNRKPDPPPGLDGYSARRQSPFLVKDELTKILTQPLRGRDKQLEIIFPDTEEDK